MRPEMSTESLTENRGCCGGMQRTTWIRNAATLYWIVSKLGMLQTVPSSQVILAQEKTWWTLYLASWSWLQLTGAWEMLQPLQRLSFRPSPFWVLFSSFTFSCTNKRETRSLASKSAGRCSNHRSLVSPSSDVRESCRHIEGKHKLNMFGCVSSAPDNITLRSCTCIESSQEGWVCASTIWRWLPSIGSTAYSRGNGYV